jgi:hypothetical protein
MDYISITFYRLFSFSFSAVQKIYLVLTVNRKERKIECSGSATEGCVDACNISTKCSLFVSWNWSENKSEQTPCFSKNSYALTFIIAHHSFFLFFNDYSEIKVLQIIYFDLTMSEQSEKQNSSCLRSLFYYYLNERN